MPSYAVETAQRTYPAVVERGCLARLYEYIPERSGKVFVASTSDVWELHGRSLEAGLNGRPFELLLFPGGEVRKRIAEVEALAEQMIAKGGDRSSIMVAFGGGVLTDVAGFVAAIFMRGIPVVQIATTLLAQVDAAVGGKTGVNLVGGKNLVGSFHQPLAVLIDPAVLDTLPEREYRAGLFEIVKHGIIADAELFGIMRQCSEAVKRHAPDVVDRMISDSVRIKAAVVSADEKESDLRRILNFGHTFGHALEAETGYTRFLHGEAVAWGMKAAIELSTLEGMLAHDDRREMLACIESYGPIPSLEGVSAANIAVRLSSDKKTVQGRVNFVLTEGIGRVKVVSGVSNERVMAAIQAALA
ncbi:MAG TPA: 3-dehydroquinate synthase [Bryobacteraceae bacterium]|nr:3-dehydroquinate synthase [Bryobacteraceae bacterium]